MNKGATQAANKAWERGWWEMGKKVYTGNPQLKEIFFQNDHNFKGKGLHILYNLFKSSLSHFFVKFPPPISTAVCKYFGKAQD